MQADKFERPDTPEYRPEMKEEPALFTMILGTAFCVAVSLLWWKSRGKGGLDKGGIGR